MPNIESCDFLIIGGGIAGLSAALEASQHGKVIILTKGKIGETATEKAQGGIAAAIDQIRDSTEFHFEDTIAAGGGLCDEKAVRILVNEGVERVKELIEMGARFDRAETEAGGGYALALEGAHKRRRILHAGDATGEEIQKTLGRRIVKEKKATILQKTLGFKLIVQNHRCVGAVAFDLINKKFITFSAKAIIIATGGVGQTFLYTTNPSFASGDGIAMAYQAGAEVCDMEFVQFHPTSLVQSEALKDIIALPRFLISEAVRGEGATLLNTKGERFMQKYDTKGELAPRDIVSRAIYQEMKNTGASNVFLSLAGLGPEKIKKRFPVIYKTCLERGLDITKDNIPVAPAAHYFMGGIKTDTDGKTNIPGLYAAGECASLGVHGANRLASNSLLDGLVFGHRAAQAAARETQASKIQLSAAEHKTHKSKLNKKERQRIRLIIKTTMWNEVGIERNAAGLKTALIKIEAVMKELDFSPPTHEELELKNMAQVAKLIIQAALARKKSVGAHYRSDPS
ncbi:L-aspartate oxidase [Candidatus Margulisiibacteriota bacterium]